MSIVNINKTVHNNALFFKNYSNNVIINDLLYYIILIILISVSPTIILGEPPRPLLKVKFILLHFISIYRQITK